MDNCRGQSSSRDIKKKSPRVKILSRAIYITRRDIGWYSKTANAYQKPMEVATKHRTLLCVSRQCHVPDELKTRCDGIVRFNGLLGLLRLNLQCADDSFRIYTDFDFPCLLKGWLTHRNYGIKWTVFVWDPPALGYRDSFFVLRRLVDLVFCFFMRRCDKIVMNIHPGMLDEIGYNAKDGQVELRLQDAFDVTKIRKTSDQSEGKYFDYDIGVLSVASEKKGVFMLASAIKRLPNSQCLWIGEVINKFPTEQIVFTGKKTQDEAFELLSKCKVLVTPYLPVPSLRWNYPLKIFEYLMLDRPIVACDNPGIAKIAEMFPNRITLFKSGDMEDLVAKLRLAVRKISG